MPPKKKKTQLKPVARGFATTSVPKKVVPPPPEPTDEAVGDAPTVESLSQGNKALATVDASKHPGSAGISKGLGEEGQASQTLVDKFQEKTEKEIAR